MVSITGMIQDRIATSIYLGRETDVKKSGSNSLVTSPI